jgi:hypothetical protein
MISSLSLGQLIASARKYKPEPFRRKINQSDFEESSPYRIPDKDPTIFGEMRSAQSTPWRYIKVKSAGLIVIPPEELSTT